jgi:hypothetical protein
MYCYGAERNTFTVSGSLAQVGYRHSEPAAAGRRSRPALQVIVRESSASYAGGTTGYGELLADREVFMEMLRDFVEEEWVGQTDVRNVTRFDPPAEAPPLPGRDREVVYSVKVGDREKIVFVLTLTKPQPRLLMPFLPLAEWFDRLTNMKRLESPGYEADILPEDRSEIVSVVIYNGRPPWTVPFTLREIADPSGQRPLSGQLRDASYRLLDIHRYEKKRLLESPSLMSAVFLLEQSSQEQEVILHLNLLAGKLQQWDAAKRRRFLRWFVGTVGAALPEESQEKLHAALDQSERKGMQAMISNVARVLKHAHLKQRMRAYAEGMEEGRAAGKREVARKMLEQGMSLPQVQALTGLPPEQLAMLLRH